MRDEGDGMYQHVPCGRGRDSCVCINYEAETLHTKFQKCEEMRG